MSNSDIKFYKIDISQRQEDVDISLSALTYGDASPKLYVSKNESSQYPRGPDTSDYFSSSSSGNIIFISSKDLVGVQNLYVGLACSVTRCITDISFEYTKEIYARADGNKFIETANSLKGASSAVVRLDIPETPTAKRIVIHVDAIPSADEEHNPRLDVFINAGDKIPFTSQAVDIPRTSWFEGKTIVIYKATELFCTECNYTLSLKFDRYSSISFEAHVFEAETVLGANAILDGVRADRLNTYSFVVPEARKDEDLVIDVKPQQGNVKLYLNCDSRPEDMMSYYWNYQIDKPTEIILTTREHGNCKTDNYFVLVTAREDSVYSIKLSTKTSSKLFVGKDAPIVGDIFPDETISYEIFMPLFAAEQIIFELRAQANIAALDLKLINCRFPTDCPGLLPAGVEFRHQIDNETAGTYEPPEFRYDINEYPELKQITINPHEEGCYPIIIQDNDFMKDPLPVCAYKVTLHSTHAAPVEYTLKADSKGHQWLFIGTPKMSSVLEGEIAYFVVNVPHKDASKVNFQLTKFSGDVDIFVSRTDAYPDEANDQTKFSHEGMILFQDQPELNGTYYIGVHGRETSTFSISATVLTQDNKTEDYAQTITLGVPQKGVILPKHEHPARFYKFELNVDDGWKGSIKIAVNTLRGSVLVAVNNDGKIPLPNAHMWNSTGGGEIEINSDDDYFLPKATYYIGVFVDWTVSQPTFDDITFNVLYYLKEDVKGVETGQNGENPVEVNIQHFFLSPLTPFHRSIKKNEVDYYEAFILPKDKGITIYKQADAGDVDIFVSLDPKNQYPDKNSFTYSTKTTFKDSIELSEEDLKKTCEEEGVRLCTFYLSVIPRGDSDEVAYSLTMKRDYDRAAGAPSSTVLEDGRQQQFNVPEAGKPVYFYFYSVPFNPSIITVSCPGEDIRIYANKNKTEIGASAKPTITPPSNELYEFTSYSEETSSIGHVHLSIPGQFNLETTVVSLAIYFKHPKSEEPIDPSTTFTILVSSQMTHIYTGKPYFGAVDAGQYQYFYLNVFKPSCTLLISMTTLNDGDPDLVVSTVRENPPTIDSHEFASISKARTELLEINELDIYPKNSMEGAWVIGVYGRTNSTFTLTVLDEDQKMVELRADIPFETYLREDSAMYFRYYHKKADNVEIRIDQLSGAINGHVYTVSSGESEADVVTLLSNPESAKWKFNPAKDSVLSIPADDPKACTECLYLISLEASASSKLSITVTEGERFIKLQNGVTYTNQLKSKNTKTYLFDSTNAEEVTLSVSMKGPSLKVYASNRPDVSADNNLWAGELTASHPHQVLSLVKSELEETPKYKQGMNGIDSVGTGKGSFYIMFENPTVDDSVVSYTFTVTSKDSSPILRSGAKHMLTLEREESTSLIYYSSQDDQVIKLNVEFSVERDTNLGEDPEFDKNLRKGVPVTAKYWTEKTTTGIGREVTVIKDHVIRDTVKSTGSVKTYHIREGFSIDGKKGKYSFDIENPFFVPITVHATVYSTELGSLPLEQNSQHSARLANGMSETYEVYMGTPGSWYLWAFACSGSVTARVSDNPDELGSNTGESKTLQVGQGYTTKARIEDSTTKYAKVENTGYGSGEAQFILSSKLFFEKMHYEYEPRSAPSAIRASSQYESINSKIVVSFEPLMIDDYDPTDNIVYHVKVCPQNPEDDSGLQNFCSIPDDCKVQQVQYKINNQSPVPVELTFNRLKPSPYYVHVTADIHHYDQFIKFIPYPVQTLSINEPLIEHTSNTLALVALSIVLLALVAFVCYKCYGRFQLFAEEKGGFELPNIGRRRGYGHLEDDL